MKILFILPSSDYDPTESSVPWHYLQQHGMQVQFCTPTGAIAHADARLVTQGFGLLNPFLMTRRDALTHYAAMANSTEFNAPLRYEAVDSDRYDALLIPGGHAPGMKSMLESSVAQNICRHFFAANKPVTAICHGVLLAARTIDPASGKSVLFQRKTTALPTTMEHSAWMLTKAWLDDYYRTYPISVQAEVTAALADPRQFDSGPLFSRRDSADRLGGFFVQDGNYLSARWPGDCFSIGDRFAKLLAAR